MRALVNGVPSSTISFDPFQSLTRAGWNLGDGIFESILVQSGVPISLTRHLRRLTSAAEALGITALDEQLIRSEITTLINSGEIFAHGRLRITVLSSGDRTVTYRELTPYGKFATLKSYPYPINESSALAGKKSLSYGENAHALRWAQAQGVDDVVLYSTKGFVSESAVANIMWESGGKMYTPTLSAGCLPGIVREILLEKFGVTEMDGVRETLLAADAIYVISSTRLIQQISVFDGNQFNLSAAGEVLLGDFQAAIAENSDL